MKKRKVGSLLQTSGLAVLLIASSSAIAGKPVKDGGGGGGGKPTNDIYAAMGDSYASGTGTGNRNMDFSCYRSTDAYGPVIASARTKTDLNFTACSGDTSYEVKNIQVPALSPDTAFVSLSVGGNDIGFVDLILNCALYFDTYQCTNTVADKELLIQTELPMIIDSTYDSIKAKAPNAEIIHVGYPKLFKEGPGGTFCFAGDGINSTEAKELNDLVVLMDQVLSERAAANGVTYISTIAAFEGHDVCASTPYVNGKFATWVDGVYHPTKAGHAAIAPLVNAAMDD